MDYANTSGIKSPFSPRVRQSLVGRRNTGLSKKTKYPDENSKTGEVVYKASNFSIETYGSPLPVLVTEALTFGTKEVSVRISECGWCWVVSGRRVVAWSTTPSPSPPAARDLTLPQTDLAHKADLVVVFYEGDAQMPSCIGVSPEGVVRYWPTIGQEGVYVDVSAELAGQECDRLVGPDAGGLLLATTTCTLVRITHTVNGGVGSVSCRCVRPPSGWLGGLGRRVSTLFFPAMPTNQDTKLLAVEVMREGPLVEEEEGAGCVALVGWPGLQLYQHQLYQHDLRHLILPHPLLTQHGDVGGVSGVRAVRVGDELVLLLASHAPRTPDLRYFIAYLSVSNPACPRVTRLCCVRGWRLGDMPHLAVHHRDILLYSRHFIGLYRDEWVEGVELASPDGVVALSGELLLSAAHALCRIHVDNNDTMHDRCVDQSQAWSAADSYRGTLALYEIDPAEVEKSCVDAVSKLKTAFLYHVRGSPRAAVLLQELFPVTSTPQDRSEEEVDGPLEAAVVAVANSVLDDRPLGDPRWSASGGGCAAVPVGGSYALQAADQVNDKRHVLSLYLRFLTATDLWQRLQNVSREGGGVVSCRSAVWSVCETAAAGASVAAAWSGGGAPRDVVDRAAALLHVTPPPHVSHAHYVFTHLSQIPDLLENVCKVGLGQAELRTGAALALAAMHIFTSALGEIWSCRSGPVSSPSQVLFPALLAAAQLHNTVVRELVRGSTSVEPAVSLSAEEAAGRLADVCLAEAAAAGPATHQHSTLMHLLITPYVEIGKIDRALVLMEKFHQHEMLVRVCVDHDLIDRLEQYLQKHTDQEGVVECALQYLWQSGRGRARLSRWGGALHSSWWSAAPRKPARALALLLRDDRPEAARALLDVAQDETDSVNRLTVIASLSKLCALSGGCEREVALSERVLALCDHVTAVPRHLRLRHGAQPDDSPVYPPEQLIQMYVECGEGSLTEYDYKKALDLTLLVSEPALREQLALKVWCASILRDSWKCPAEEAQHHIFNRLLDLMLVMGENVELIPPLSQLEAEEGLRAVVEDPEAHYTLRYWYRTLLDVAN